MRDIHSLVFDTRSIIHLDGSGSIRLASTENQSRRAEMRGC
jgi:hypothetical protein